MAATTTAPKLVSSQVIDTTGENTDFLVRTTWKGTKLADGTPVDLVFERAVHSDVTLDQTWWDATYGDMYTAWTTATGDTTHSTSTIDIDTLSFDAA